MNPVGRHFRLVTALGPSLAAVFSMSCGAPAKSVSVAAPREVPILSAQAAPDPAPDVALTPIRTGRVVPVRDPLMELTVSRREAAGDYELLELIPPGSAQVASDWNGYEVALDAPQVGFALQVTLPEVTGKPADYSSASHSHPVLVRRRRSDGPITGTLFTAALGFNAYHQPEPGRAIPFHGVVTPKTKTDPGLERAWDLSLADQFSRRSGAFFEFAARRLRERQNAGKLPGVQPSADQGADELLALMDTTTGRHSIEQALQRNHGLALDVPAEKQAIDVKTVKPPELGRHPWDDLLRALGTRPTVEPLAAATPADFYFARARDTGALLDLLDVVEDWGQPAAAILDGHTEDRGTFTRYATELALERTGLARTLGPELIEDVAIIGSDPYVHEGTDVTLVLRPKNTALLGAALSGLLSAAGAAHGGITSTSFVHEGTTVSVGRAADGRVRQHRASVSGLELVSNSAGAIRRVLSTMAGHYPRLSDEPDFRYMLARDGAVKDQVLAYIGDRFVAAVVSPKQKIAEARRLIALSELSVPAYAALLSGIVDGASPKDTKALLASKLLRPGDLRHADGSPITFEPGQSPNSKWGSVAEPTPLIDLPEVARVTKAEASAYSSFARSYEFAWSDKIDPIALRVTEDHKTNGDLALALDLRVLPLLRREYREVTEMAGDARVQVPPLADGARVVVGIGKDARLRDELSHESNAFGVKQLTFDWLGAFAFAGIGNTNRIANIGHREIRYEIDAPVPPGQEDWEHDEPLSKFPGYAGIDIRSRAGAAIVLTVLREKSRELTGASLKWGAPPKYRDNDIVSVSLDESKDKPVTVYYSLMQHTLVAALTEAMLHAAIDQILDAPPHGVEDTRGIASGGSQLVVDVAGREASAFHRLAEWAFSAELSKNSGAVDISEPVLRGAPEVRGSAERSRALFQAYFGVVPLTAEGSLYEMGPEGVRDPVHGTAYAPIWPDLPVPGSLVDRVISRLSSVRSEISFDKEPQLGKDPPLQSLHVRLSVGLRGKR